MRSLGFALESRAALLCQQQIPVWGVHPFARSVDDLKDIGNLDAYVARAKAVLVCCTDGYFMSKNCVIELRACVKQGKLIIPLLDPDTGKGGLTKDEVHEQLVKAEKSFEKWFSNDDSTTAEELFAALFVNEPVEFNRIGAFQDV